MLLLFKWFSFSKRFIVLPTIEFLTERDPNEKKTVNDKLPPTSDLAEFKFV